MPAKRELIYYGINGLSFYLLPLLPGGFLIGAGMAVICFLSSLIYGLLEGFRMRSSFVVALLFVPAVYLFFDPSARIYVLGLGLLALSGSLLGSTFHD